MINDNPILGNQLVVMSRADLDALVEKMTSNMIAMRVEDKSTHENEVCPSTVLHQMEQDGKLPCKTQSNSSPNSLPVATNLPSALAKVKDRFPTIESFMVAVNPDRQLQISEHPEVYYSGLSPTLASLNVIY